MKETYTFKVTESTSKYNPQSYKCSSDKFESKLTPSQMEAIRRQMRLTSLLSDVNDEFEVNIQVLGKVVSLYIKKNDFTYVDMMLDRSHQHYFIGKRGKVTKK